MEEIEIVDDKDGLGMAHLANFFKGVSALILEDDACLADQLCRCLSKAGFEQVDIVGTGRAAVKVSQERAYDVLLFDRLNPDIEGATALAQIRASGGPSCHATALLVTALSQQTHRVEGYLAGADDYVPKPIDEIELLARIGAQLRRAKWNQSQLKQADPKEAKATIITNGPMRVDLTARLVLYDGAPVQLTGKEFSILAELVNNCGYPVTRLMLWDTCWPEWTYQPEQWTNTIDVAMRRLRKALAPIDLVLPPGFAPLILNVRSEGFLIRDLTGPM